MKLYADCFYFKELFSPFHYFSSFVIRYENDNLKLFSIASDRARLLVSTVNTEKFDFRKGKNEDIDYIVDARKLLKYLKHIKSEEKLEISIDDRIKLKTKDMEKNLGLIADAKDINIKKTDYPYHALLKCKKDMFDALQFVEIDSNEVLIKKNGVNLYFENLDDNEKTRISVGKYVDIVEEKKKNFEAVFFVSYLTNIGKFITDDFTM